MLGPQRQLPRLGTHHCPGDAQKISDVTQAKKLESRSTHLVFADVNLEALLLGLHISKHRLALPSNCHQTA